MKRIIYQENLGYPITVEQRGIDRFLVRYGKQENKGDYEYAARKLGEAIFHALTCEGRIKQ